MILAPLLAPPGMTLLARAGSVDSLIAGELNRLGLSSQGL